MGEDKPKRNKEDLVAAVLGIIGEYTGMRLTLRQIYYRLVAQQFFANVFSSYKWLGNTLVEARKAGEVPYDAIEDRTRKHIAGYGSTWTAEGYFNAYFEQLKDLADRYSLPRWWGQSTYVQVWLEKQALESLFLQITNAEAVDLEVCRGYPSLTFLWEASEKLQSLPDHVDDIQIIYFGDFDPSGEDIERYVKDTLQDEFGIELTVQRIAITQPQIGQYNIPPAPAKTTDSRYEGFVARTGVAWQVELDAIEPRTLQGLIRRAIERHWDAAQGTARDMELGGRRRRIKRWVRGAINRDFTPPRGEDMEYGGDEEEEEDDDAEEES